MRVFFFLSSSNSSLFPSSVPISQFGSPGSFFSLLYLRFRRIIFIVRKFSTSTFEFPPSHLLICNSLSSICDLPLRFYDPYPLTSNVESVPPLFWPPAEPFSPLSPLRFKLPFFSTTLLTNRVAIPPFFCCFPSLKGFP